MVPAVGVSPNLANKHGVTPVHAAALGGSVAALAWLNDRGANLAAFDNYHTGTVSYAAVSGDVECVRWCIERGLGTEERSARGRSALHWAAKLGNLVRCVRACSVCASAFVCVWSLPAGG